MIANFESHYNTVLDKCFVLLEIFGVGVSNVGFQIRSLLDAKPYAAASGEINIL